MITKSKKKIGDRILEFADNEGHHAGRTGQAQAVMLRCPKCGRKISATKDSCPYCGHKRK